MLPNQLIFEILPYNVCTHISIFQKCLVHVDMTMDGKDGNYICFVAFIFVNIHVYIFPASPGCGSFSFTYVFPL